MFKINRYFIFGVDNCSLIPIPEKFDVDGPIVAVKNGNKISSCIGNFGYSMHSNEEALLDDQDFSQKKTVLRFKTVIQFSFGSSYDIEIGRSRISFFSSYVHDEKDALYYDIDEELCIIKMWRKFEIKFKKNKDTKNQKPPKPLNPPLIPKNLNMMHQPKESIPSFGPMSRGVMCQAYSGGKIYCIRPSMKLQLQSIDKSEKPKKEIDEKPKKEIKFSFNFTKLTNSLIFRYPRDRNIEKYLKIENSRVYKKILLAITQQYISSIADKVQKVEEDNIITTVQNYTNTQQYTVVNNNFSIYNVETNEVTRSATNMLVAYAMQDDNIKHNMFNEYVGPEFDNSCIYEDSAITQDEFVNFVIAMRILYVLKQKKYISNEQIKDIIKAKTNIYIERYELAIKNHLVPKKIKKYHDIKIHFN